MRELTVEVVVLASFFKAGLNAHIFATIHFLKVHEDSYTFDTHSMYAGFLALVTSKFMDR